MSIDIRHSNSFFRPWPLILGICLLIAGCDFSPSRQEKTLPLTSPQQKFQKICLEEYQLPTVLKAFEDTLWIYIPLEKHFFETKASDTKDNIDPRKSTAKPEILYLEGDFINQTFTIEYDISPTKKYAKSYGYESAYTDEYNTILRQVLQTISRAYSDVKENPDNPYEFFEMVPGDVTMSDAQAEASHQQLVQSHVKTPRVPTFFVIVLADITSGIQSRAMMTFSDLRRAMQDAPFYEEYTRRSVFETPTGDKAIIGDKEGTTIGMHNLTWGEFLARQMIYRINYKYARSSHAPSENAQDELIEVAVDTVKAYSFKDFTGIDLNNLATGERLIIGREKLMEYVRP